MKKTYISFMILLNVFLPSLTQAHPACFEIHSCEGEQLIADQHIINNPTQHRVLGLIGIQIRELPNGECYCRFKYELEYECDGATRSVDVSVTHQWVINDSESFPWCDY